MIKHINVDDFIRRALALGMTHLAWTEEDFTVLKDFGVKDGGTYLGAAHHVIENKYLSGNS